MSGSTFVELSELTKSCWWGKRDVGEWRAAARSALAIRRRQSEKGRQDSGVRAAHKDLFLVVFNVRHLNNCQVCYGLLESAHAAGCG